MAGMQVSYVLHSLTARPHLFCVLFPRLITARLFILFIVSIRLYRRFLQCPGCQAAQAAPAPGNNGHNTSLSLSPLHPRVSQLSHDLLPQNL